LDELRKSFELLAPRDEKLSVLTFRHNEMLDLDGAAGQCYKNLKCALKFEILTKLPAEEVGTA
jgi:hypothetical protein